jgi:hypothetical protein
VRDLASSSDGFDFFKGGLLLLPARPLTFSARALCSFQRGPRALASSSEGFGFFQCESLLLPVMALASSSARVYFFQ